MLGRLVRGGGLEHPQQHRSSQTRLDELQQGELHKQQREGSVEGPQRGHLDDPEGPLRPHLRHNNRRSLLPHPSCAAEEAFSQEEVRSVVQLR